MRLFFMMSILAIGLAVTPAAAVPIRTLAFDLPSEKVSFDVSPADGKADSKDKLRLEARKNQFTVALSLPHGRYVATSADFKTTATFTLTEGDGTRFLLLVLPNQDGGCAIIPIPDDIGRIAAGDRFLINATREELAVRFGTKVSNVKSGHSLHLQLPQASAKDPRIEVEMARRVDNVWVPFSSTYWPADPRARSFVLVHPDPVTGTPRVRNLSEVP